MFPSTFLNVSHLCCVVFFVTRKISIDMSARGLGVDCAGFDFFFPQ